MTFFKKPERDMQPLLFLAILIMLVAAVFAYVDLKRGINDAKVDTLRQVFE